MAEYVGNKVLRVKVGKCPVCHEGLWADVEAAASLNGPRLGPGSDHVLVDVVPRLLSMRVSHECEREDDE